MITVLMPVYNVESFIKESIESVLNQSYSDFELLIIDDGSTDNSVNKILELSDSRIRLIKKDKNLGLIDSLNLGIKLARGKYIARMDGDDISTPNRFQKQLDVLLSDSEIKVCGCWLQRFGNHGKIIKHKEFHDEIVAELLMHCSMSLGAVMFEKKALENYHFDENKKHVEDYDFWSRVSWASKLYNIQEVLYHYRSHDKQVTKVFYDIQRKGDIDIKLFLFKKLNYDTGEFPNDLITRMIWLTQKIAMKDLVLFFKWIKQLDHNNRRLKIFSQKELREVLRMIKRKLVFELYFEKTSIGLDKKWRLKALAHLPINEMFFVVIGKIREMLKIKMINKFNKNVVLKS
ncbi:glycosyltransferase involved in cell wall biosynthesis [Flavobacterium sp. 270]|nr:glycosyltransferase involved in cell wall biosynthesis [Flavobacterium sp. 270]